MTLQAGTLDPSYGERGIATPPADPPDTDTRSLQVLAVTRDELGRLVYFGSNPQVDAPQVFARLDANGQYDADTGQVVVEPVTRFPDSSQLYRALLKVEIDGRSSYLAVGTPIYFDEDNYCLMEYLSVCRYDEGFKPVPSFGDEGMALPDPGEPWVPVSAARTRYLQARRRSSTVQPAGAPNRALALIGGVIRTIFTQVIDDEFDNRTSNTLIALIDPHTGAAVNELGEKGDQSVLELTSEDGRPLFVFGANFLSDGGFILLAGRADGRIIVKRYLKNGLPSATFAGGEKELDLFGHQPGLVPGMDVSADRIVVSRAMNSRTRHPLDIFCFDLEGRRDPTFNGGEVLRLHDEPGTLGLSKVHIQDDGKIVLAGNHLSPDLLQLCVARLTREGVLEKGFGADGYFKAGADLITAHRVFINDDGIRVATEFPTYSGWFLERAIKLFR